MNDTAIVCAFPNKFRKNTLIATEDPGLSTVMAGIKLGSIAFVAALVDEDERLAAQPISYKEKIDLLKTAQVNDASNAVLAGWLVTPNAIDEDQESILMEHIEKIEGSNSTTHRHLKQYWYSHDLKDGDIKPANPFPDFLLMAQ